MRHMIQLPEEFDSIFRYIVVVSQRAEQIINGAKPRTESRHAKQTLKARDDVDGGAVGWRVLSQEELDAHRQAMVEQFRAEVGAVTEPEGSRPIPDVLPTAEVPAAKPDADPERDDELARLQRLLGMTGQAEAAKKIEDSEEAKKEEAKEEEAKEEAPVDLEVEEKKKG
jgi:DNA-directed RNA polymerase subunit K/omega